MEIAFKVKHFDFYLFSIFFTFVLICSFTIFLLSALLFTLVSVGATSSSESKFGTFFFSTEIFYFISVSSSSSISRQYDN